MRRRFSGTGTLYAGDELITRPKYELHLVFGLDRPCQLSGQLCTEISARVIPDIASPFLLELSGGTAAVALLIGNARAMNGRRYYGVSASPEQPQNSIMRNLPR